MKIQDFYDGTPQIADNMNGIMLNPLTTTPGRATHDALSYRAEHRKVYFQQVYQTFHFPQRAD